MQTAPGQVITAGQGQQQMDAPRGTGAVLLQSHLHGSAGRQQWRAQLCSGHSCREEQTQPHRAQQLSLVLFRHDRYPPTLPHCTRTQEHEGVKVVTLSLPAELGKEGCEQRESRRQACSSTLKCSAAETSCSTALLLHACLQPSVGEQHTAHCCTRSSSSAKCHPWTDTALSGC